MKLGIVGKGGVGKTTLSALLASTWAAKGRSVVAIDTDSNPNLGFSLGLNAAATEALPVLPRSVIAGSGGGETAADLLRDYGRPTPAGVTILSAIRVTEAGAGCTCSGHATVRTLLGDVLEQQTESKPLAETLTKVRKDVEAGLPLSDSMERHPKVFNGLFVAMTRAGETGGMLEDALLRVADQLEADDDLRRKVKSAMAYPAVVLGFSMLVLIALIVFIVPVFVGVFEEFDSELPAITKFTVFLSETMTKLWYVWIAGGVGGVIAFQKWRKSTWGRPQWDRLRLRIPFKIGDIVQKVSLARWSRTFSALTSAGVPVLEAIEITGKTAGNTLVERAMDDVTASVKRGGTIAGPLGSIPVFPAMVT
ncbi:MAG: type II secretion system F family protein, partial [Actinobacteria bacterium]|nr:type II secretion system F family protein [Actinomycetota bacterium]